MSDTITCPNCSATLPSAAAFCTTCGTRVAEAAPAPPPPAAPPMPGPATFAPPVDPTRVDAPPPGDPTQVFGAPPASAPPPPTSAPWQPADTTGATGSSGAWTASPSAGAPAPSAYGTPPPPSAAPTGQVPAWSPTSWDAAPVAGQPVKARSAGSPLGAALAVLGGILTIVGIFLPWVTSNLSDAGLSGWDLTSGEKGFRLPDGALLTFESMDPYALLVIGVIALGAGALALKGGSRNLSRVLGVVLGVLVIGFMVRDWTSLAEVVESEAPASFEVSSAVGFYLTIAGGALVILSALMPSQTAKS